MHRVPQGAQLPRFRLWVFGIKVREECDIIQVPQARCIVSHHVRDPRNVIESVDNTEVTLMQGGETQKVLGWFGGRGGSFPCPYQRGGVVAQGGESEEVDVDMLCEHIMVGDNSSQLEFAVVHHPFWMFGG
jgi:hypothetical protein